MKNSIELDSKDELEAIKTLKVIKSKYFFLGNRLNNSGTIVRINWNYGG